MTVTVPYWPYPPPQSFSAKHGIHLDYVTPGGMVSFSNNFNRILIKRPPTIIENQDGHVTCEMEVACYQHHDNVIGQDFTYRFKAKTNGSVGNIFETGLVKLLNTSHSKSHQSPPLEASAKQSSSPDRSTSQEKQVQLQQ